MTKIMEIQLAIVGSILAQAIQQGYDITVYDSVEYTLKKSTNADTILAAMFKSGGDTLHLSSVKNRGTVKLVYGLNGFDMIEDFSPELEPIMLPALRLAEKYRRES